MAERSTDHGLNRVVRLDEARRKNAILKSIATALGEPEDTFLNGAVSKSGLDDTREMLRIWNGLKSASDRRKLLAFARTLLADRS